MVDVGGWIVREQNKKKASQRHAHALTSRQNKTRAKSYREFKDIAALRGNESHKLLKVRVELRIQGAEHMVEDWQGK